MSKADKKIISLGYLIEEDKEKIIIYKTNKCDMQIYVCVIYKNYTSEKFRLKLYEQYMPIKLLQAINEKVKELRLE